MKTCHVNHPIAYALGVTLWILILFGCSDRMIGPADALEEDVSPQQETGELVLDRLAPASHQLRHLYTRAARREIAGGIAHYEFDVRMGPEEFDVVRIHRVVRERRRSRPVRTRAAVFMVPGSGQTFDAIFLRPGVDKPDARTSAPVYLAAGGVDVWGIDLSWTQVSAEVGDVSFMRDWGVERDVDHTLAAMSIARRIRGLTGKASAACICSGSATAAASRTPQQHGRLNSLVASATSEGSFRSTSG